jgi:hypothetical protein
VVYSRSRHGCQAVRESLPYTTLYEVYVKFFVTGVLQPYHIPLDHSVSTLYTLYIIK